MKYLVMECHPGYAVVLDAEGRFLKVANLNYEVGQTVTSVIEMNAPKAGQKTLLTKRIAVFASLAACLCLTVLGSWKFLLTPYGSVRMQINPDVQITVNRMDYVIGLDGLNQDGEDLIEGYPYGWKKVDAVSDDLADRAMEMGYLKEGGTIRLTVESEHEAWQKETEDRIILELVVHVGNSITVTPGAKSDAEIIIPVDPLPPQKSDGDSDDDDWGDLHDDEDDPDDRVSPSQSDDDGEDDQPDDDDE